MSATGDQQPSANSANDNDFKLENLKLFFSEALVENDVRLDKYLAGYHELFKFLNMLGTVFGWVASDVKVKIEILEGHLKNPEKDGKYATLESMIKYETEAKLIKHKAKDSTTGTRNLLRLHRALQYINKFLDSVQALEVEAKTCGISQEAYKTTLSKHHPWVVQKAALLAMHMLPTKEGLISKICGDQIGKEELQWASQVLQEAVAKMEKVYDLTQKTYEKYGLLDLP